MNYLKEQRQHLVKVNDVAQFESKLNGRDP